MKTEQQSKCAACGKKTELLVVDHDHTSGAVRGLLCTNCNLALGHVNDNPDLLLKAIAYLKKHGK